ncbi:MAG TPA: acylneuraminate cytidylyltransferase [Brevundimonas sp.]|nr:acylneuraminate cytidylyltransferase [Brevundimonas sp.]
MSYIGFIPARAGSERVKYKNTRPFAGYDGGLLELKLLQLSRVSRLSRIIVSSNDPAVLEYAATFSRERDHRVEPCERPNEYGTGATSMETFIKDYIAHLSKDGTMLWTHVTHPFVRADTYDRALDEYERARTTGCDSLVSVNRVQKFLWKDGRPFNYDNTLEKWPRSQDLEPLWDINHAIYIMPFDVMRTAGDRITPKSHFFEIGEDVAMDIDWEEQFLLVEEIARARIEQGRSLL